MKQFKKKLQSLMALLCIGAGLAVTQVQYASDTPKPTEKSDQTELITIPNLLVLVAGLHLGSNIYQVPGVHQVVNILGKGLWTHKGKLGVGVGALGLANSLGFTLDTPRAIMTSGYTLISAGFNGINTGVHAVYNYIKSLKEQFSKYTGSFKDFVVEQLSTQYKDFNNLPRSEKMRVLMMVYGSVLAASYGLTGARCLYGMPAQARNWWSGTPIIAPASIASGVPAASSSMLSKVKGWGSALTSWLPGKK
jgi:hypothetical protein